MEKRKCIENELFGNQIVNRRYETEEDSFFYNYIDSFMQFLEDNRVNNWQKRKDYKEKIDQTIEIKGKYPNIRKYLEKDEIIKLNKEELKVLKEYFCLIEEMQDIELVETFKLGLKEGMLL